MIFYKQISIVALLFCSACMVGPKYTKPSVKLPKKFTDQQQAASVDDLAAWWNYFEDPCLTGLVEKAVANNYDLRIALEKIKEARALYRIQGANLYPEVDLDGSINRTGYSENIAQTSFLPQSTYSYFDVGLDASWEIDIWGKLRRAKQAAYDTYQAYIEAMHDVYIILLSDITKAYIDSRSLGKKIDLLTLQITFDTKLLDLTHGRFLAGIDSQLPDVDQQAVLQASRTQLLMLQTAQTQADIKIALLLGENPEEFLLPSGAHRVPQSKKELEVGLPSELLQRRPDIRQAERLLAATTENVGQAVAEWFPSFSLLGDTHFQANKASQWFSSNSFSWSIGPSMSWPIITFGRIRFNIEAKKSAQRQALLAYGKSVVNALSDVEQWLIAYFNGKKEVAVLEQKLQVLTKKSDLTHALLKSGLANELDFLIAEKNRLSAELELTDAEQALSSALVSVYKALGGGW